LIFSILLKGTEVFKQTESHRFSDETLKILNGWLHPSSKKVHPSLRIKHFRPSRQICKQIAQETGLTTEKIKKWMLRQQQVKVSNNVSNSLLLKNHFLVDKFPKKKTNSRIGEINMSHRKIYYEMVCI
jgi:hypothetical protein